jgi:periplasmic protein TonB
VEHRASFSSGISDGPTFAALGVEDTSASGGGKKILIGVVALVALITLAYFGWTQFGQSHSGTTPQQTTPAAQPAPQDNPSPQLAPMSSPAPAPTMTVERASTSTTEHVPKSLPAQTSKASVIDEPQQITLNGEPTVNKTSEAPLRVKAAAPSAKPQPQTEEAAAQPPSPLGMKSSDGANLSSLLPAPNTSRPTLARVKLSQGISQGLLIKRVAPKYPSAALQMHLEGTVQIEARIDKEGIVTNPKVVKGDHILAAAALDAVRQWRYKPYYLDGEPVEVETEITINFKGN